MVRDWNDMERIWQYVYSKDQLQTFSEEVCDQPSPSAGLPILLPVPSHRPPFLPDWGAPFTLSLLACSPHFVCLCAGVQWVATC